MTCIVGLVEENGVVWMGGDRAATGYTQTFSSRPKVFAHSGFLFGYTTSFRFGDLLEHAFRPLGDYLGRNAHEYLVTDFIPELIETLDRGRWLRVVEGRVSGGDFLVGFNGGIYHVQDDFSVLNCGAWAACGSGEAVALGSLHSSEGRDSGDRVRMAVRAAGACVSSVGGLVDVLSI